MVFPELPRLALAVYRGIGPAAAKVTFNSNRNPAAHTDHT
jgi:hypothetical protein